MNDYKWPPDYLEEFKTRIERLQKINADPKLVVGALEYYRTRPAEFINDWCVTYDPRTEIKKMPFILFPRQVEFIEFLYECWQDGEAGLVEKCRDVGASWLCCCFAAWMWIFVEGSSVGFGSKKEILVDRLGDMDSLFEKIRLTFDNLPSFFLPVGFKQKEHATYMKIISPASNSSITGAAGDGIGRGGRSSIFFKDESAHYDRPEKIEAALSDNTDVQIDISSVNGTASVFYKKRQSGIIWERGKEMPKGQIRVFIFDWRDHPAKTQEWYDRKRAKFEAEGLLHVFAQEVDRDYCASVVGMVIPPSHVKAAIDAHKKLKFKMEGQRFAGLDVADEEGADKNAIAIRHGVVLLHAEDWAGLDTTKTANHAVDICVKYSVNELYYDCIGVGAGVRGETNNLKENGKLPPSLEISPWNAGLSGVAMVDAEYRVIPSDTNSPLVKEFYANMKAQAWWALRMRFEKTYKAVMHGAEYDEDELISIDSTIPCLHQITNELSQSTWKKSDATGKIIINKQPPGTESPNLADSIVSCYFPPKKKTWFRT